MSAIAIPTAISIRYIQFNKIIGLLSLLIFIIFLGINVHRDSKNKIRIYKNYIVKNIGYDKVIEFLQYLNGS
jgi:hypothetical protein